MVWARALLSVMTGAACAEPATKYAICPISCLGLQRVGMLLTCVEVKHLSEEQKELVSGLSAPSQLDVQETCRFLSCTTTAVQ